MTRRPETSAAPEILGEVVAGAADAHHGKHAGIKRHRTVHEPLCDDCRTFERAYRRDYFAVRNSIEAYRLRDNAAAAKRMARKRAADVEGWRRQQRTYRKKRRDNAERDRLHVVDDVVVLRLLDGEQVPYNRAERIEAVRQMRQRGLAYQQIADRLHVTERRVHRDLAALGMTAQGAVA